MKPYAPSARGGSRDRGRVAGAIREAPLKTPPNAIPQALTEKRNMKKVKEIIRGAMWFAVAIYALAFIGETEPIEKGGEA